MLAGSHRAGRGYLAKGCALFLGMIFASAAVPAGAEPGQPSPGGFHQLYDAWLSLEETATPAAPAIFVSKASDALGRPIDISRSPFAKQPFGRTAGSLIGGYPDMRPVASLSVTSGYGIRRHPILGGYRAHLGMDFAAPAGSPIVATSDGVVSMANWYGGYGLFVSVEHGGGLQTRYGHMSRLNVVDGQRVRKGEVIGFVGSTGRSTGPHLHYEVRLNGQALNPAALLSKK